VTRMSRRVNQVVFGRQFQGRWPSFRGAALVLASWGGGVVDRDGHTARVNYVGGSF